MTIHNPARVDRRALSGALALGSCMGLALGGAYLAGGLARTANAPSAAFASANADARLDAWAARMTHRAGPAAPPLRGGSPLAAASPATERVPPFALRGAASPSRDLQCLSQAVYYEARGEAANGQAAVAQVVLNRVRHPHFPKSVCGVVFQRADGDCQFSFVCGPDMRRPVEGEAWKRAETVAQRALAGFVMAQVGSATDFRAHGIAADGMQRVAQLGGHVFYRFAGHLGAASSLTAQPRASTPGETEAHTVVASFAPPSARDVLAAGAQVVQHAAAAVDAATHPAAPAAPVQAPPPASAPAPAPPAVIKTDAPTTKPEATSTPVA